MELLEIAKSIHSRDRGDLIGLEAELKRAIIVDPKEVPTDVITMNSQADLVDLDTGEKVTFTVVFPRNANVDEGRISVLAPLGAAMLGYRAGAGWISFCCSSCAISGNTEFLTDGISSVAR